MTLSVQGKRRLVALEVLDTSVAPLIAFDLPIRLKSRANDHTSNHWGKRSKTTEKQHGYVKMILSRDRTYLRTRLRLAGLVVRMVRVAPLSLDDDNLAHAFKAIRDGIALELGINDRDERIAFVPDEERGRARQYAVRLEFYEP